MRATFIAVFAGLCMVGVVVADPVGEPAPRLALPSDTGLYRGYQVGGGAGNPRKAEPRRDDDGTWGWDYQGVLPRRINLGWWHGRRYQGGSGAYKTDGPRK